MNPRKKNLVVGTHWFGRTMHIEGYPRSEHKHPLLEVVGGDGRRHVVDTVYWKTLSADAPRGDKVEPADVEWYRDLITRCIEEAKAHVVARIERVHESERLLGKWFQQPSRRNWDKLLAEVPKVAKDFVLNEDLHRLNVWEDVAPDEYFEKFVELLGCK